MCPNIALSVSYHAFPVTPQDIDSVTFHRAFENHTVRAGELEDDITKPLLLAQVTFGRPQGLKRADPGPLNPSLPHISVVTISFSAAMRYHVLDIPGTRGKQPE